MRLDDFRVERNGNGRDLDIVPTFAGGHAGSYVLRFDVLTSGGSVPLHASGLHLDGRSNGRVYVPSADVQTRWPGLALGQRYRVRATLTLDPGTGSAGARWSAAVIEEMFPRGAHLGGRKEVAF